MLGLRKKLGAYINRRVVAVELDTGQVRIVEAQRSGGRVRISKLISAKIPHDVKLDDAKSVGEFLAEQLKRAGASGPIMMNIPRTQVVLKSLSFPGGTTPPELPNMVRYQLERELPFSPEEAVIDYTVQGASHADPEAGEESSPGGLDVLAAAVRLPVIDHHRQIAQTAGVKLAHLGFRPCSVHRCIRAFYKGDQGACIGVVHITADETEISFICDGRMVFSRSAVVKIPSDIDRSGSAAAGYVNDIVAEVARTQQSFHAMAQSCDVTLHLLAGGTGIEQAVADELSRRLRTQCELFDIEGVQAADATPTASGFVATAGLAIGSCDTDALPFDFVNPKRAKARRDTKKLRIAALTAAAAVILLVSVLAGRSHLAAKRSRLDALTTELAQLKTQNKQLKTLVKRVDAIDLWVRTGRNWLDHLAQITALLPNCTSAYVVRFRTQRDNVISFSIRARNSEVIGDLCRRLARAGYKPSAGQLTTGNDPYGLDYPYTTEIKLTVPPDVNVDLGALRPKPRPADDDSANRLTQKPAARRRRARR